VHKYLSQLASGSIKVPYGEIRQAAPDLFTADDSADGQNVTLPLQEVLSRLNPALLTRRPTQKQLVVPEEIASPFSGRGEGLNFAVGNNSPQAPGAPVAPQVAAPAPVTPVPRASSHLTAPLPGGTDMFQRRIAAQNSNGKAPIFPRKPGAPAGNGTEFTQRKPAPAPAAPALENVPDAPIAFKPVTPIATEPAAAMAPVQDAPVMPTSGLQMTPAQPVTPMAEAPVATPQPATPPRPKDLFAAPPVARSVQPAQPVTPAATTAESNVLTVPLVALAESWPEAVRQEIVQFKLAEAQLAMPVDIVESSLKRGRVAFNWKTIRSWVRPGPAPATSPNDARELELPLVVIAPLFVARRKSDVTQPRVTVAETIPNLFFGLPKPESAPAPKAADTNFYTWGETSDHARVDDTEFKRRSVLSGGTELLVKCATPNEIVSRAAALDGVAGALIALPDGLMVASAIPPEFNGDTLAAFLPHIFSKVSQCTKELRMGDLNNLNFTVGNVPWKIFRVNAIFFAAFGRVGEGLPTAELASLAGELDRKRS
jgi:predicted regulator of Ras-like GTPase activity (Roadblock/LC7/MglB family)